MELQELRDEIYNLYWKKGYTIRDVGKKLDIPRATVQILFYQFGLRTRTKKQALRLYWKRKMNKLKRQQSKDDA